VAYDKDRGFIKNITVTGSGSQQLFTVDYGYNGRGDTKTRHATYTNGMASTSINETYTYSREGHFRLENRQVDVTNPQNLGNLLSSMQQNFSYDSLGNLKTKSGVGTYHYDTANPYRLTSTSGAAAGVRTYAIAGNYDSHGNITADGQRTFEYNQADMPTFISKGTDDWTRFDYAPDNSRIYREDSRSGSISKTWYVGKTYEYSEKGSDTEQRWYIGNVVMSQSSKTSGTNFEVLHGDAQGSTVTVTDGSGKLVSHSLYDAWGQQSVLQVGTSSQLFVQSLQRRGYTGHENVEGLGIIHMNGRIYDPLLARFVQADPTLQFPQYSQGYNRYSYVLNNPMTYTDPSGYFLTGVLKSAVRSVIKLIPQNVGNFMISLGAKLCGPWAGACAAAATYEFSRAHGMSRTGALRAAAAAGAAAYAFGKIGEYYGDAGAENLMDAVDSGSDFSHLTSFGGNYLTSGQIAGQIAAHAMTGGIVSSIGGGKFGHGFFSAGVTKGLGTPISAHFDQGMISGTITQMVIGGTASVISGGKFVNGARTAAYQALFNQFSKWAYEQQYKKAQLRQFRHGRDLLGPLTNEEKQAALNTRYPKDADVVVAHGSDDGYVISIGGPITMQQFYKVNQGHFDKSDNPILLLLCFSGSFGSAQILANLTGRMVIAPNTGHATIHDATGYSYGTEPGAYFKEFYPAKGK
jgi:RHS repeat-associated protein